MSIRPDSTRTHVTYLTVGHTVARIAFLID
jgi:hypothetical protein